MVCLRSLLKGKGFVGGVGSNMSRALDVWMGGRLAVIKHGATRHGPADKSSWPHMQTQTHATNKTLPEPE